MAFRYVLPEADKSEVFLVKAYQPRPVIQSIQLELECLTVLILLLVEPLALRVVRSHRLDVPVLVPPALLVVCGGHQAARVEQGCSLLEKLTVDGRGVDVFLNDVYVGEGERDSND